MRRLILTCAVLGVLLLTTASASVAAQGAQTFTQTFKNQTETFVDVVPCSQTPAIITIIFNGVVHGTVLADGSQHFTFTQEGTFTIVAATGTVYTGHFASWDGDNANQSSDDGTFTLNVIGTGSDGTRINAHLLGHFNVSASGQINEVFKMNCR